MKIRQFEGCIDSVDYDNRKFIVTLIDKDNEMDELVAEFNFSDVLEKDLDLVKPGTIFDWFISAKGTSLAIRKTINWKEFTKNLKNKDFKDKYKDIFENEK